MQSRPGTTPCYGSFRGQELWGATERHGRSAELQEWLLAQACAEAAALPDPDVVVVVSLPAGHVTAESLSAQVAAALASSGLAPERLMLSVTEETLLTSSAGLVPELEAAHATGVQLCLDNYGMGHSLFALLARLSLDVVRVDLAALGRRDDTSRAAGARRGPAGHRRLRHRRRRRRHQPPAAARPGPRRRRRPGARAGPAARPRPRGAGRAGGRAARRPHGLSPPASGRPLGRVMSRAARALRRRILEGVRGPELTFLGHSTVRIELAGRTVLTDPVLTAGLGPLRRVVPLPDPSAWAGVDVVVISHLHGDHLHLPSLRMLGTGTRIVVPRGAGHGCAGAGSPASTSCPRRGLSDGALHITAVHARHSGHRWGPRLTHGPASPAVGHLVEAGGRTVYAAGDTDLFDGMEHLGRRGSTSPCCRCGAGARRSARVTSTRAGRAGGRGCCVRGRRPGALGHPRAGREPAPAQPRPLAHGPAAGRAPARVRRRRCLARSGHPGAGRPARRTRRAARPRSAPAPLAAR